MRCPFLDSVTKRPELLSCLLSLAFGLAHSQRSQLLCGELPCAQARVARSSSLQTTASAAQGLPTASREKWKQILRQPSLEKTANLAKTLTGALRETLNRGSQLGCAQAPDPQRPCRDHSLGTICHAATAQGHTQLRGSSLERLGLSPGRLMVPQGLLLQELQPLR